MSGDFVRRLDSHIHLFEAGFFGGPLGSESRDYQRLRIANGIVKALVIGYEGAPGFEGNNGYIHELAQQFDWIVPLAWVSQDRPQDLPALLDRGFAGISLYLDPTADALSAWSLQQLSQLGSSGLVSINAGAQALASARPALAKLHDAAVMISHLGSPGALASGMSPAQAREHLRPLIDLARLPSVYVKLSGLYDIDPSFPHSGAYSVVMATLEAFGVDRVMWGSDFAPARKFVLEGELFSLPGWLEDELTQPELDAITGGTLASVLSRFSASNGLDDD